MDFPTEPAPLLVPTFSRHSLAQGRVVAQTGSINVVTWTAALCVYTPLSLPWHYPLKRMFWNNGSTVGGTATIGLYTRDGANLYRSAAITTAGASAPQFTPLISPDLLLLPGLYYIGLAFSGTTNVMIGPTTLTASGGRLIGLLQQAAIPAAGVAATFAQWTGTVLGVCGITQTASGF